MKSENPPIVGKTLGHYRIVEKLGEGGQGTVYKAIDTNLGRTVVVKAIPPELTSKKSNVKRFEREAKLASSLDHPNICTIFDFDEIDGTHFIAMQYVPGRNVRQLVAGRPLELSSALSIAVQVTEALSAAHAQGIIHRDIKATNVMVMDKGQAKVLDFGLAKLIGDEPYGSGRMDRTQLTEIGVPYGTATYAAPEQARGDTVDHRADIFSTGVLLYEMLTGTWPFRGKTSVDVRHAVLNENPKPLAEARGGDAPPRLQQILDRAMAKDPRDRYQRMTELRDDLRAVWKELSATSATLLVSGEFTRPRHAEALSGKPFSKARMWFRQITQGDEPTTSPVAATPTMASAHSTPATDTSGSGPKAPEKKSIAILPFKNFRKDPEYSFYEFSLADAVITELARLRSLIVRPSSLIAQYQGVEVDPRQAGREMRVDSVLVAGFLHGGDRIRVTAQLLDVASGDILWSERIDADARDLLDVQDTIAQKIAEGLSVEQPPADSEVPIGRGTRNAEAYEEYLRGRDAFARFIFRTVAPEDCDAAIGHFKRAIQLDSKFALAFDGLGACHVNRVFKGLGDASDYAAAEAAFNDALALDPGIVEARMLMVFIYLWHGEKRRAREEVESMRRQAPDEAVVYFVKATLHRLDGEYDRSLRAWNRLVQLDPAARVVAFYNRALIYIFLGRLEDALGQLDLAADEDPEHPLVKAFRALALYYQGLQRFSSQQRAEGKALLETATSLLRDVLAQHPGMHGIRPFLAMCLAVQGNLHAAREQLTADVERNADVDPDIAYSLGSAHALLNDAEPASRWLRRSIEIGNGNLYLFEHDPNLAALRNAERLEEVRKRIAREHDLSTGHV